MMKRGKKLVLTILILVAILPLSGQDIHFSQFFNSPSNINPGLTGFSDSRMRVYFSHRNQWSTVSLPFQTYSATIDAQLLKRKQKGDMLGIGFSAFSDKAGDSHFGTQTISVALNYVKALGDYSTRNLIGFGILASYYQRSLDYQSLVFDQQYNGLQFDPNLFHGEYFAIDKYSFYDISAGINWHTNINYDINLQSGLSVWHITRPTQSLLNDESVRLTPKIIFHSEAEIIFTTEYRLLPAMFFQHQGAHNEVVIGSRFKYISSPKISNYAAFLTGIFYRGFDAIILYTGYQHKTLELGLTYDFNISTLKNASRYLGGFEININWRIPANRTPKQKDLPCPIF